MAIAGTVKLEVIASAQENIRAVLAQSNAAIRKTSQELKKADLAQSKMGSTIEKVKGKVLAFKAAIAALGLTAVYVAAQQLFELAKQGAVVADQLDAVKTRVSNAEEVIAKVRASTTDIVDDASIVKGIALFDAFGLEMAQLPGLMEQASKTSLRTGESVDFLVESAIKGVARMSPAIIDNLGLQITLADATQAAADKFGVEADALDATQKKAGMLSLVLKKLGEQNKDIDLNNSRVASLQRAEVAIINLKNEAAVGLVNAFTDVEQSIGRMAGAMSTQLANAVANASRAIDGVIENMHTAAKKAIKVDEALEKLALTNRARQYEEKALALEVGRIQADADRAKLVALKILQGQLKIGADEVLEQIRHAGVLNRIRNRAAEAMKGARKKAHIAAMEMLATERATLEVIHKRRQATMRELDAIRGITKGQREIKALQAENAELEGEKAKAKEGELEALDEQLEANEALILVIEGEERATQRVGKARVKVTKDVNAGLQEKLNAQLFSNKLDQTKEARDKVILQMEEKRRKLRVEMVKIGEHELATKYKLARAAGINLEQKRLLNGLEITSGNETEQALERAKLALAIAKATTDTQRIDLELQQKEAELAASALSSEEAGLMIDLARLEAQRMKAEIAQEERERFLDTLGEGIGGAFGSAAGILGEIDATLEELNRPAKYKNVIKAFNSMSQTIGPATKKFAELGDASLTSGQKIGAGMAAGLSVVGPATAAFVESTRDKALVMAAFEAAMAVAMAWVNPAEAVGHGVAAAMFLAMAGVAASQPSTAIPEEETEGGGALVTPAAAPEEQIAQRININFGPGMLLGLPQELGRAISDQINSMAGTGMEATSF